MARPLSLSRKAHPRGEDGQPAEDGSLLETAEVVSTYATHVASKFHADANLQGFPFSTAVDLGVDVPALVGPKLRDYRNASEIVGR